MPRSWKRIAFAPILLLAACEPGEVVKDPAGSSTNMTTNTGPDNGTNTGAPQKPNEPKQNVVNRPYCKRVEQVLPNADTPIGKVVPRTLAQQATAQVQGLWMEQDNSQDPMVRQSISPSANMDPGKVTVAYADGAVRLVKNQFVDCTPGVACAEIEVTCIDQIEIEMQVSMNSNNGVFAETWTGVLSIPDPRDPDLNLGEPEDPKSETTPTIPKEYRIEKRFDTIAFAGTATLKAESTQPGFKISRNQISYAISYFEGKPNQVTITSNFMVKQDPLPGDGSGMAGGGRQLLYTLEPKP